MILPAHIMLRHALIITSLIICVLIIPVQNVLASNNISDHSAMSAVNNPLWDELTEGFDASFRILAYGTYQGVAESTQNPDNDFLKIPRFLADLDIRPDFFLQFRRLEISVKPRIHVQRSAIEDGSVKGERDWEDEWYINEWFLKLGVTYSFFLSYGRENLQWGPSYLFSPSNPFFKDNGRMNPKIEVPGMGFARLVWVPSIKWAFSFIANTDKGHQIFEPGKFRKSYAVKIDYTGNEEYAGLVLAHRGKEKYMIGAFGGWTATDAVLLYADIGFSQENGVLYPAQDNMSPFGISMRALNEGSSEWNGTVMMGASYTFMAGPTVLAEYLYNDAGYSDEKAEEYYRLRQDASDSYYDDGPVGELSKMVLGQTIDSGMRFLRKNYLVLQYRQNDIRDVLNLSFSWIYNVDDKGGRFVSTLEYAVGDHVQIFSIGSLNTGAADTEFRSVYDSSVMLGLEYTF